MRPHSLLLTGFALLNACATARFGNVFSPVVPPDASQTLKTQREAVWRNADTSFTAKILNDSITTVTRTIPGFDVAVFEVSTERAIDPDPIPEQMDEYFGIVEEARAFADKADKRANALEFFLKASQFGGSGAAVATGSESVDRQVGMVGGVVAVVATAFDLGSGALTQRKRRDRCRALAATKPQINDIRSAYIVAKERNDSAGMTKALTEFEAYRKAVSDLYSECVTA